MHNLKSFYNKSNLSLSFDVLKAPKRQLPVNKVKSDEQHVFSHDTYQDNGGVNMYPSPWHVYQVGSSDDPL